MNRMDEDLFTYEVEIPELTNIPCDLNKDDDLGQPMTHGSDDDKEYDPSDRALWDYWTRGNDEVELTDEETSDSDDENEVAKIFRIETNGFKTYDEYKDDWIYEWNNDVPWVDEKSWTDDGAWKEPTPVEHYCKPFNYKCGCSEWPTCSWKNDGYCNGGNLPGAYIVGNSLEDGELKGEALRNKAIMDGIIDDDDELSNEGWRNWDDYDDANRDREEREHENEHEDKELCDDATQELPVCRIKRYMMIKYSFGDDEKYAAIKEDEYDDLTSTSEGACRAY
ncbi:hypothetical protein Tco_0365400 [Tanacetum coccineum]